MTYGYLFLELTKMELVEDRVDIIVPFYPNPDGRKRLKQLEQSIKSIDPGFPCRLVVAEGKQTVSKNRNFGLRKSDTRYYLACDDDVKFLERNWLLKAMNKMKENPFTGVVGFRTVDKGGVTTNAGRLLIEKEDGRHNIDLRSIEKKGKLVDITEDRQVNFVPGCCMLIDRTVAGFFPEELYTGKINCEDADHQLQIQINGYKIYILGSVTVFHDNNDFSKKVKKYELKDADAVNHIIFEGRWNINN